MDFTVAHNLSAPHAAKGALSLAGVEETFSFFFAVLLTVLLALEQGLHCCTLGLVVMMT